VILISNPNSDLIRAVSDSYQIADAVIVARSLGAALVIPDIRGSQPDDKRLVLNFIL